MEGEVSSRKDSGFVAYLGAYYVPAVANSAPSSVSAAVEVVAGKAEWGADAMHRR